jgi:hypothetical protein
MLMHPSASGCLRYVLVMVALLLVARHVQAQHSDMPATLPDNDSAAHDNGTTRLLDENAERTRRDDLPATLPDDALAPPPDSGPPPIRFEASVNGALAAPLGHNPDVASFGFAVTYGIGWGEIPLAIGIDYVSLGSIGDATSQLEVELRDGTEIAERYVSTRLMHFDAWLRLQPAHFWIRPYAEGFYGAQLFQGRYVLRSGNQESDLAQAEDWGRNFGWGAGVELANLLGSTGMSLTLGMRYVYGANVRVSRPVVLANERMQVPYEADTDVLLFMLGIGLHYELGNPRR